MILKFLALVVPVILVVHTCWASPKGATTVDELRASLIQIEDTAWQIIDEPNQPSDRKLEKIIAKHNNFATINLGIDYQENEFITINHMYEWKYLEHFMTKINGFFTEFRRLLARQTSEGLEELSNMNFADLILEDVNLRLNDTMTEIHDILVKQGLYYKIFLVS